MFPRFKSALHSRFCSSCPFLATFALVTGIAAALAVAGLPLASSPAKPLPTFETWLETTAPGHGADFAATMRGGLPVEIILR
ncbi:MAG: hypothetical protein EA385_02865 [Salinarimonadaceae bacterium]|nr:MAG: hypothetical protein EA385_02865 [Salinarimonadaceae bacterium]